MGRFALTEHLDDALVLHTKFGKLVAWVVQDDSYYKEFAVDLIANDGKEYQVAVIGTDENGGDTDMDKVHVYLWDGIEADDPDCCFYMNLHGDGWYFDPKEE